MWNSKRVKGERSERWQREDAAARLAAEVPELLTLSLQLRNCTEETSMPGRSRTQHVIVERAAALFEIACVEPKCEGGGYDITSDILHALRQRKETLEGTSRCNGSVAQGYCRCTLIYVMKATYRPV
jgi:hypothetical protein